MFVSQPAHSAKSSTPAAACSALDIEQRLRCECLEQLARSRAIEARVARLDAEEEVLAAGECEALDCEQRVIEARQPVRDQHRAQAGERSAEDRQLERHGHERGPAVQWTT